MKRKGLFAILLIGLAIVSMLMASCAPMTSTVTQPAVTTIVTQPATTVTLPAVTTTLPIVTTTLPIVTTTLAAVTTTLPVITTTLPVITTTLPPVTTTQYVSGGAIVVTVTPPPVTTTLPPVTTTVAPTLIFSTGITTDVPIIGSGTGSSPNIIIPTVGIANVQHILTLSATTSTPVLKDGNYAFVLQSSPSQQTTLNSYFAAKTGWTIPMETQIGAEINGISPFFYLKSASGVYSLADNFKQWLGSTYSPYPLTVDDDYPVGTYVYNGTLIGNNGASLSITVTMTIVRSLTFNTGITSDGTSLEGTLATQFTIVTTRSNSAPAHVLALTDTASTPALADGSYAFTLQATSSQKTALTAYFAAKVWPSNYLTQINTEINGTSPFFYLKALGGSYSLVDGFKSALSISPATLTIDDNYPIGTYIYTGILSGSNGATIPITVTLVVQ